MTYRCHRRCCCRGVAKFSLTQGLRSLTEGLDTFKRFRELKLQLKHGGNKQAKLCVLVDDDGSDAGSYDTARVVFIAAFFVINFWFNIACCVSCRC